MPRPIMSVAVWRYARAMALAARKENVQAAEGQNRPEAARNAVEDFRGGSRVVHELA